MSNERRFEKPAPTTVPARRQRATEPRRSKGGARSRSVVSAEDRAEVVVPGRLRRRTRGGPRNAGVQPTTTIPLATVPDVALPVEGDFPAVAKVRARFAKKIEKALEKLAKLEHELELGRDGLLELAIQLKTEIIATAKDAAAKAKG